MKWMAGGLEEMENESVDEPNAQVQLLAGGLDGLLQRLLPLAQLQSGPDKGQHALVPLERERPRHSCPQFFVEVCPPD